MAVDFFKLCLKLQLELMVPLAMLDCVELAPGASPFVSLNLKSQSFFSNIKKILPFTYPRIYKSFIKRI